MTDLQEVVPTPAGRSFKLAPGESGLLPTPRRVGLVGSGWISARLHTYIQFGKFGTTQNSPQNPRYEIPASIHEGGGAAPMAKGGRLVFASDLGPESSLLIDYLQGAPGVAPIRRGEGQGPGGKSPVSIEPVVGWNEALA